MKIAHWQALACGTFVLGVSAVAAPFLLSEPGTRASRDASRGAATALATPDAKLAAAAKERRRAVALDGARTPKALPATSGPRILGEASGQAAVSELVPVTAKARAGASESASSRAAGPHVLTAEEREKLAQNLARVDWGKSLKDLVAAMKNARASGKNTGGETFVEAAEVNLALAEAASQLGLKGPAAALGDPTVRSVVVPAWLDALGANLDPAQAAAISSLCLTVPSATATAPTSFLEARQAAIQSRIALEQSFSQVLTPDQLQAYASNVANDPLMKPSAQRLNLSATSPSNLSGIVASYWTYQFQLGSGSQQAAQQVATHYVSAVMAVPPVAPNLGPEAARIASLDRANQLVALQQQAEQALAASASLSAAEKGRAGKGSNACLQLAVAR